MTSGMVEVSQSEFRQFIRSIPHAVEHSTEPSGHSHPRFSAIQFIDKIANEVIAQAVYYEGGHRSYQIRSEEIEL